MTKNTRKYFAIIICVIIICSIMGIFIRNSYTGYNSFEQMEDSENLEDYRVFVENVEKDDDFFMQIKSYNDLENTADVIAKVSATNERELSLHKVTKTEVIVEEVYKGNVEKGQTIFIYEPAIFSYSVSKSYQSLDGYQLMKEGEEYYVFLQNLKTAKGYKMSEKEKNTYLPNTASYSKFPVQQGNVSLVEQKRLNDGEYSYDEIQNLEIITSNQKVLSKYNRLREKVINKFGKILSSIEVTGKAI